jgi:hypothetical protein
VHTPPNNPPPNGPPVPAPEGADVFVFPLLPNAPPPVPKILPVCPEGVPPPLGVIAAPPPPNPGQRVGVARVGKSTRARSCCALIFIRIRAEKALTCSKVAHREGLRNTSRGDNLKTVTTVA